VVPQPERCEREIEPEVEIVAEEQDVCAHQRERPQGAARHGGGTGTNVRMDLLATRDENYYQGKGHESKCRGAEESGGISRTGEYTTQCRTQEKPTVHERAVDTECLSPLLVRDLIGEQSTGRGEDARGKDPLDKPEHDEQHRVCDDQPAERQEGEPDQANIHHAPLAPQVRQPPYRILKDEAREEKGTGQWRR